ncbi:2-succinyl-5-enolpyruvyl-6-hydroxy-3-cyclohexene-1-carboxylic-acid synthase [Nocardioides sp. W7]|uniref:2-succinyl-5-enolpyruvyl-6-hydroxy-3- cyclohexene-1-carboxylic-acid synthase n=1 Tax=Nocardioides sp. W7 TaxID=2931390 RepID=UPI001FD55D31|nr:2-succinyl-5-enolpyruvyl-6-hydroxy-3-cyclohexene-1-carboxylic-acid synthase [Nocardioides sp. W7]
MYSDDPLILELLALLKSHGVSRVVIAPGSRHYPIARSLESDDYFTLHSVVDERSAGFFALGLIQASRSPVATLCTSGTAAVNLGSAVVEAFYQRLPLLVMTADRLPQLLGQMEDQMIDQTELFKNSVRSRALLRAGGSDLDRWYNNRSINTALLALTHAGGGPVHLNIPIASHSKGVTYTTSTLPRVRVIRRSEEPSPDEWAAVAERLDGKRVLVVWGQGASRDLRVEDALKQFADAYDVAVMVDHLSAVDHDSRIPRPYALLMSGASRSPQLVPDIVITVGGNTFFVDQLKRLIVGASVEHWRVHPDGEVVDPFQRLTDVFQCGAAHFFTNAVGAQVAASRGRSYASAVREIALAVPEPDEPYGELAVISAFLKSLPAGCVLHLANSAPIRMAHLYDLDPSITVLSNRGVNGIDGSMSTALGFAAADERLNFLLVGDLSFFYDMNALWIRDRARNLRILLINNGGGALMHAAPLTPDRAEQGARHISAGHAATAKGWVESLGITYSAVRTDAEVAAAIAQLTDATRIDGVVVEIFTEKVADIEQFKAYQAAIFGVSTGLSTSQKIRRLGGKVLRRLGLR